MKRVAGCKVVATKVMDGSGSWLLGAHVGSVVERPPESLVGSRLVDGEDSITVMIPCAHDHDSKL
jgi:hypothetical protein